MGLIKRYAYKVTAGFSQALSGFWNSIGGYWPLQEPSGMAYDFKFSGNGTNINGVPQGGGNSGPGGAYPKAFEFNGSNHYFQIADSAEISGAGDLDRSMWAWVYLTDKSTSRTILSKWGDPNSEFSLRYNQASDRYEFLVSSDGTGQDAQVQATSFGSPPTSTWTFLYAYFWASGNELGIQVNRGTINTSVYTGGIINGSGAMHIGALFIGSMVEFWQGRLAGLAYIRGLNTTSEVDAIYNGGIPNSPLGVVHLDPNTQGGIEFPIGDYEYAPSQALRVPRAPIAGGDYDFRLLGGYPGLKGAAQERIRFTGMGDGTFLDALVDSQMGIQNYGLCRLWTIGDDGSERWAWVSLANMPEYTLSIPATLLPATLTFDRWSNWYAKYKTIVHLDTGNTGDTLVSFSTNGNARIDDAVITIRGDSWTNPFWNNSPTWQSNLYIGQFSTARDISSNLHRIRADGGRHKVEWSTDNGQGYVNDYGQYSRPAGQARLTVLVPGGNTFAFSGTRSNTRAVIEYFDQWHS